MQFPRTEADIAALAVPVAQGLTQASEDFPTPPVAPDQLQAKRPTCSRLNSVVNSRFPFAARRNRSIMLPPFE
jgi:hypothetical protein